ncbi:MAG: HupE/UreJ family protein [Flavobacterium sp.]|nr:HupE/UreJ family protein [Flavobacterium sp.]
MSEFWTYFQIGLYHVLNLSSYDHILFLAVLVIPYAFKDWKRVLMLVSFFTIGHTVALLLSVFNLVFIKEKLVEFVIPITILLTAIYDLLTSGKSFKNNSITLVRIVTLFFGIVHGLAFSSYFKTILSGSPQSKLLPMIDFALGIEVSQITIVLLVLLLSYLLQSVLRFSKREITLVISSFVIGVILPIIIKNSFIV